MKQKRLPKAVTNWIEQRITEPAVSFFERHDNKRGSKSYRRAVSATKRQYKQFAEYFAQLGEPEERIVSLLGHSLSQRQRH